MRSVFNYFAFVILVSSLGAVKFRCDYKYSHVGWMKYHAIPASWSDARLRCRYEGGTLASPATNEIKAAMVKSMQNIDILTGIHATVSPGSYYTLEGIPLDTISPRWAAGEPDNKKDAERCISMNSKGDLADVRCNVPRPYLCYRPNSSEGANECGTTDPEYRFESRTNKCYKFHTNVRPYRRAHLICSAEGGHLAIINSEVESQVVRDLFAQHPPESVRGYYWPEKDLAFIGFHNYGESADWVTLEGQTLEEAGFARFRQNQPDNSTAGEYCGSAYIDGSLNDAWCERHFFFICEKYANFPAVCDNQ